MVDFIMISFHVYVHQTLMPYLSSSASPSNPKMRETHIKKEVSRKKRPQEGDIVNKKICDKESLRKIKSAKIKMLQRKSARE
jgi:hypothetical protein